MNEERKGDRTSEDVICDEDEVSEGDLTNRDENCEDEEDDRTGVDEKCEEDGEREGLVENDEENSGKAEPNDEVAIETTKDDE